MRFILSSVHPVAGIRKGSQVFNSLRRAVTAWLAALTLVFQLSAAEAFRFAWLSDTHIGYPSANDDVAASVRDINARTDLSFVVLSGDVTGQGSLEELKTAKELLNSLKIPLRIIPGNHDTKWSESGATDFARLWKADRFVFEFGGFKFIGIHQGPLMKMGDGHWAPQDVRWLDGVLAKTDKNQPLIFITHYPLDEQIDNWFEVLDRLKQFNTQAVLVGHLHRNMDASYEGVPGVVGRSNLSGKNAPAGYNIVEIKDGRITFSERNPGGPDAAPWHSIPLKKHDFTADKTVYPRPDYSVNAKHPGVKPKWRFSTDYTIASSPAPWKNTAIVGDASGTVYGLSLDDGKPRWTFKAKNAVYSTPDTADGKVVFASADGCIYALNAANGRRLWRVETPRPIVACPVIDKGAVFIGSSDGKFRALNLRNGKPLWTFDGLKGFVETRPLIHGDKVIFGAWDGHLYALEAKTGKLVWKWAAPNPAKLLSPAACWPVAAHGKVFVAAPDRMLTAVDEAAGQTIWRTGEWQVRESLGLSADQSCLYARTMRNWILAFSTRSSEPEVLWKLDAGFEYDINSAQLAEKDGVVFYGTKNGVMLAMDAKTGRLNWEHKLCSGLLNTPVPLDANHVLAADFDGCVTLLEVR